MPFSSRRPSGRPLRGFQSDQRKRDAWSSIGAIALAALLAVAGCSRSAAPANQAAKSATPTQAPAREAGRESSEPGRTSAHDLSVDEAMGGHTLARHIGKTDLELVERLRREPDISSASTYIDRDTAERTIAAALASSGSSFGKWRARQGRRPNFVLRYDAREVIGRSVRRGHSSSVPCERALVVLRWDDRRQQFYVLTSYPEEDR